ncbi:hypothetical protein D7Z54_15885 [Salibacterium salarium]|uniref:Type II secretory pathway, pseudopilin PulG n=1 Tax=Salibacterium salarium TaxID=284579 RepID=A0A3R9QKH6_9BACI|nr:type II secretion system protein [Salibacterium salarium]RSL32376.1 hypothetical protein D7Z54_15885 [Salibacterium salarium]
MNAYIRNQKGYTMLLVLLTITIIGIMVPIFMSSIMNSSTQYKETEENIQLQKLADMGSLYFEKEVEALKEEAKAFIEHMENVEEEDVERIFYNYIEDELASYSKKTISIEENHEEFTIELNTIHRSDNEFVIDYTVIPSLNGGIDEGEPLTNTMTINMTIEE